MQNISFAGASPRSSLYLRQKPVFKGAGEDTPIPTLKSQDAFETNVERSTQPTLVKFEKKDCPDCIKTQPLLESVAKQNPDKIKVFKALMWDENNPDNRSMKKLAFKYGIRTVPLFLLFDKGKEVMRGEGENGLIHIAQTQSLNYGVENNPDIPPPYQPPGAVLTVLFDGECSICRGTAEHLKTLDKNNHLALVPLQSPLVRQKYPDLKLVDLRKSIHVVNETGKVFKGADAFNEIGKTIRPQSLLGYSLKLFTVFSKIPGVLFVTDKIYLEFSKHRFLFQQKQANCAHCTLDDTEGK